jgi:Tellurite resistance protein TerB
MTTTRRIDHHAALIYTMVLVSAADQNTTDAEMSVIGDIVGHLPIFRDYDRHRLGETLRACGELMDRENGLDEALAAIEEALPPKLRETAYALACDVVAADSQASQEELRLLEILRDHLHVDRLVAVAIERATRARFARL